MTEIAKCAWCGKEPEKVDDEGYRAYGEPMYSHECDLQWADVWALSTWNEFQRDILAARRKDFEGGWKTGVMTCDRGPIIEVEESFADYIAGNKRKGE